MTLNIAQFVHANAVHNSPPHLLKHVPMVRDFIYRFELELELCLRSLI